MPWTTNFRRGTHLPTWDVLAQIPTAGVYNGGGVTYDGSRYLYIASQRGSTSATTVSSADLWRYDTWTDAFTYMVQLTNANNGLDVTYDPVRNVLHITSGNAGTEWRIFNLNRTSVSISGVSISAYAYTSMSPVLPATPGAGATVVLAHDIGLTEPFETGTIASGSTSTSINVSAEILQAGLIACQIRLTSGAFSGQKRTISAVGSGTNLTVNSAFGGAPSAGDTYVIELPDGTATAGAATTLTDTNSSWPVNAFANSDVVITGGTGSGQRRRIASNTATVLTLASATTGNPRTGNWATNPDATSTYEIRPSSDFLYYLSGGSTSTFYRLDVATGASSPTWTTLTSTPSTIGGGANLWHMAPQGPFSLIGLRGNGTKTIYRYSIAANTWATLTDYIGTETLSAGSVSAYLPGLRKIVMNPNGQLRLFGYDIATFLSEGVGTLPFGGGANFDRHGAIMVTTADGVRWLYFIRNAGGEMFRVALEWL